MNNIIKINRAKMDLTQMELADKLGVAVQTIRKMERNEYSPTVHQLVQLSVHLELSLDELVSAFTNDSK